MATVWGNRQRWSWSRNKHLWQPWPPERTTWYRILDVKVGKVHHECGWVALWYLNSIRRRVLKIPSLCQRWQVIGSLYAPYSPQRNALPPVLCSSTLRELRLLHVQPLQVFWLSGLPSYILDLVNILPMSSSASSISRSRTLAHPIAVLQLMQKLITLLTGLCNRIAQHHHVRIYLFTTDWRCLEEGTIFGGGGDFKRMISYSLEVNVGFF